MAVYEEKSIVADRIRNLLRASLPKVGLSVIGNLVKGIEDLYEDVFSAQKSEIADLRKKYLVEAKISESLSTRLKWLEGENLRLQEETSNYGERIAQLSEESLAGEYRNKKEQLESDYQERFSDLQKKEREISYIQGDAKIGSLVKQLFKAVKRADLYG